VEALGTDCLRGPSNEHAGTTAAKRMDIVNSPLAEEIGFTNSGATRMVTTGQHNWLSRLTQIQPARVSRSCVVAFDYS